MVRPIPICVVRPIVLWCAPLSRGALALQLFTAIWRFFFRVKIVILLSPRAGSKTEAGNQTTGGVDNDLSGTLQPELRFKNQ